MKTVKLDGGQYTIVYDKTDSYPVKCLRYGEEQRDLLGDNLIFWLCARIEELEEKINSKRNLIRSKLFSSTENIVAFCESR